VSSRHDEAVQNVVVRAVEQASGQGIHLDHFSDLSRLLPRIEAEDSLPREMVEVVSVLLRWIIQMDHAMEGHSRREADVRS